MSGSKANRIKRLTLAGIGIIGLVVLAGVMTVWSSLPRWKTYTFPSEPASSAAIAIDYTDGWKPKDMAASSSGNPRIQRVVFRPLEPTGMALWWRDTILRQKPDPRFQPNIAVTIWHNMSIDIDRAEQGWKTAGSNFKKIKVIRTLHPLGPALEIEAQIDIPARPGVGGRAASPAQQIGMHNFLIYPGVACLPKRMCLSLSCSSPVNLYAGTDARFRAMTGRVRVVQAAHR